MKHLLTILVFSSLVTIANSSCASGRANLGAWEKLGKKTVNFKLDKDVLHVGTHEGSFKILKLEVTGGSVNMHKMVVHYGNGNKETIHHRQTFRKGSDSRNIDLSGNNRIIKQITFFYDRINASRKKATVHVFGKH